MKPPPELVAALTALSNRVRAARNRPEPLSPDDRAQLDEELRAAIAAMREFNSAAAATAASSAPRASASASRPSKLKIKVTLP